ncbi:MAG: hypothetical protein ACREU4_13510 [Burkholderiales bacterium]
MNSSFPLPPRLRWRKYAASAISWWEGWLLVALGVSDAAWIGAASLTLGSPMGAAGADFVAGARRWSVLLVFFFAMSTVLGRLL